MLNLEEGQIFDNQYELLRLIDTGGFTEVWEAKYLTAGNTVALKVYPKLDEEGIRNIEEEYKRLFELQHSNLLSVLHFGRFNGYPYLVMRYYPGGNASKKIGTSSEKEIARCMLQIGDVLKYLHANNIVHQDIKPNNFLLDQFGNYFLADLGLSLKVRDTIRMSTATVRMNAPTASSSTVIMNDVASMQTGLTPPPYRAPELYDRNRASKAPLKATDIWAFGASLYEMITSDPPFGDLGGLVQMNNPAIKDLPKEYSRELNTILKNCLDKDPAKRPQASDLAKIANQYIETGSWTAQTKEKKSNPLIIITITILMMVIGVFAIKKIITPAPKSIAPAQITETKKDTPIAHQIKVIHPPAPSPDTPRTEPIHNPPPAIAPNIVVTKYPHVRTPPHSNCAPTITSIARSEKTMKITFFISSCSGSVSIYPPGSEHAFYMRSNGDTYELLSISRTGDEITVPKQGLTFTATFRNPGNVSEIDILEGRNRLDIGTSFFNFKGVSLK